MTKKKGHQKFWEIDVEFFREWRNFFGKFLKKVVQKFRQKFGPPRLSVCEGLDPLVTTPDNFRCKLHPFRCSLF